MAPTTPMSATWMLTKTMSTPAANTAFDWVCRFHYPFCINHLINYSSQGTIEKTRLGKAICRLAHQPMGSAGMSPLNIVVYDVLRSHRRHSSPQSKSKLIIICMITLQVSSFQIYRVFLSGLKKKKTRGTFEPRCQLQCHMALVVLFLKWNIFPIVVPNLPSWMNQSVSQSVSQSVGGGK